MSTRFEVVVVGAGPAGLMVAAEVALRGVGVRVVDRSPRRSPVSRGFNLNARSLEILELRGLARRFLAEGPTVGATMFGGLDAPLDLSVLASDHPYVLGIAQTRIEELLEQRAAELGAAVRWSHEVTGIEQDRDGVTLDIRTPGGEERWRAAYVTACDGSRSAIRKGLGIGFPGSDPTGYALLGDVELARPGDIPFGLNATERGSVFAIPRPGYVRLITADTDPPDDRDHPVPLARLQEAVDHVIGRHVPLTRPRWLTRFGDGARLAERYLAGRVALAGDAAHVHPPAGALGVNVAIADAVNLGWKLAATVRDWAPPALLETYHDERHAAGERLLRMTLAQTSLSARGAKPDALRGLFAEVASLPGVGRHLAEMVTGIDTSYEPDPPHPWVGRMAPNLRLETPAGATTLAALMHGGAGLLLELRGDGGLRETAARWSRRVAVHTARCPGHPDVRALLVRPDGHVAWVRASGDAASPEAPLTRWFGTGLRPSRPARLAPE